MPSYIEDFHVGQIERFGGYAVTREEVIDFASRFDPQTFHLDDAAAAANPIFGRLAASGWHTAAMTMRMLVDHEQAHDRATLGSPGMDEVRFLHPVYPGDTLDVEVEVIEARVSRSRPDRGVLKLRMTTRNQHGEPVLRMTGVNFQPRRTAPATGSR